MVKLYLVRHGETIDNERKILQGQEQGELNVNGLLQAEAVRRHFEGIRVDAFISSDLKRSIETCRIIMGNRQMDIFQTPLLRERDWGDFTGMFIPDLKDKEWPMNVETLDALKERAKQFLSLVRCKYSGKVVLAVGHGIINKAIQSVYTAKPMNEIQKMGNAEIRELIL